MKCACIQVLDYRLFSTAHKIQARPKWTSERACNGKADILYIYLSLPFCMLISTWHKTTNKMKQKYQSCSGRFVSRCFFPPILLKLKQHQAICNMVETNIGTLNATIAFFLSFSLLYMWKCKYLQNAKSIKQNGILTERERKLKHPEKSHLSDFDGFIMFDWVNVFSIYIFYLHMYLVSCWIFPYNSCIRSRLLFGLHTIFRVFVSLFLITGYQLFAFVFGSLSSWAMYTITYQLFSLSLSLTFPCLWLTKFAAAIIPAKHLAAWFTNHAGRWSTFTNIHQASIE